MNGIAGTSITITDATNTANTEPIGLVAMLGITERGNTPRVVRSFQEFERYFGGFYNDFALYVHRALQSGAPVLVGRVSHYSDPADTGTATFVKATGTPTDGGSNSMAVEASSSGAWGNSLSVEVKEPLSKKSGVFDVYVNFSGQSGLNEVARDVPSGITASLLSEKFNLVDVTSITGVLAVMASVTLTNGADVPGDVVAADYVGDATAGTGIHQFDSYEGYIARVCIPTETSSTVQNKVVTYANSLTGATAILRTPALASPTEALNFRFAESSYSGNTDWNDEKVRMVYGTGTYIHPETGNQVQLSLVGDYCGLLARKDSQHYYNYSLMNTKRGRLEDVTKLDFLLSSPAYSDLADQIDAAGITFALRKGGSFVFWSNATLYKEDSMLKFANVADLVTYLEHFLPTMLETYIGEPNDISTWRNIYNDMSAYLNQLRDEYRAIYSYQYEGDQDVDSVADVSVNNATDIASGIYKVNITLQPTAALKYITLNLTITNTDISLSVADA